MIICFVVRDEKLFIFDSNLYFFYGVMVGVISLEIKEEFFLEFKLKLLLLCNICLLIFVIFL